MRLYCFAIVFSVRPNLAEPYLVDPHLVAIVSSVPFYLVDTYLVD